MKSFVLVLGEEAGIKVARSQRKIANFCERFTALLLACTGKTGSMGITKGCRNSSLRQPLQCRGDWNRTSDLLNPIQEDTQRNPLPDKPLAESEQSACTSAC